MILTPKAYNDYFETIATNNKQIAHVAGSDDTKRFYALDLEEVLTGQRRNFTGFSLILENMESNFYDGLGDNVREYQQAAYSIVKNYDRRNDGHDVLVTILDDCYKIVKQIQSKIFKDRKNRILSGLDVNSFHIHKVGPILSEAYGYRCTFQFNEPAWLKFEPSQWDNETPLK